MYISQENLAQLIGAVIAVLLQIIVAPNIAISAAVPNFLLAYVLVLSIIAPTRGNVILAFVLGLLFNLLGGGPVGLMSLLMVVVTIVASRAFTVLNNASLLMPMIIMVVCTILVELVYGAFMLGLGMNSSILEAFAFRALPCALYDCVLALVIYPIAMRFLVAKAPTAPGASTILR